MEYDHGVGGPHGEGRAPERTKDGLEACEISTRAKRHPVSGGRSQQGDSAWCSKEWPVIPSTNWRGTAALPMETALRHRNRYEAFDGSHNPATIFTLKILMTLSSLPVGTGMSLWAHGVCAKKSKSALVSHRKDTTPWTSMCSPCCGSRRQSWQRRFSRPMKWPSHERKPSAWCEWGRGSAGSEERRCNQVDILS